MSGTSVTDSDDSGQPPEGHVYGALFAQIPEWLLDTDVSDRAIRLFAVLHRYVRGSDNGWDLRRKTLADRLGCSVDSVDRATKELEASGAVITTPNMRDDGGYGASTYWLWPMVPDPGTPWPQNQLIPWPQNPPYLAAAVRPLSREPIQESQSRKDSGPWPQKKPRRRATPVPESFPIDERVRGWQTVKDAIALGIDIEFQRDKFLAKAHADGVKHVDWDHAFRYWLMNQIQWTKDRQPKDQEHVPGGFGKVW